jgi:FkbM family methyltransferase
MTNMLDSLSYWSAYTARIVRRLGVRGATAYFLKDRLLRMWAAAFGAEWAPTAYRLYSRESGQPLLCRLDTTDRLVFRQVFIKGSYDEIELAAPRFIIDGGANVGHSSAFLLTRFPTARVVAVEADDRNFELLARNIAPFGYRATAINAAIWSHRGALAVSRGTYLDGREWSTQVVEHGSPDMPRVEGIDIGSLIKSCGMDRVDLLKLDVEGAELPIFKNCQEWIGQVDVIAVELHDEACRDAFLGAIHSEAFEIFESGELTIARRRDS